MKLSHLFEAVNPLSLLKEVSQELDLGTMTVSELDGMSAADAQVGIDLFRLHLDSDGSAQVRARLQEIERLSMDSKPLPDGMEGLEYLEGTSFEQLPHVHAFHAACKAIQENAKLVTASAKAAVTIYFLLGALNTIAITTMSSNFDDNEVKYRASIARAAMKQLGMTPKDL